ncbi:MAG: DUF3524 domain-containing protein [Spirochaetaceae bacterium]|nr:MAG: DUF3524 domain-containing protein [Spirochaetaceae bacterium]
MASMSCRVLLVESFYGGSHAAFADGLVSHSTHRIDLMALPAQNWRWRTRTAALEFGAQLPDARQYDAALVTDLIDLADLKAIWSRSSPAILLYVHESQLTYPYPKDRNPDMNTALQDIKNCLVADRVLFNSHVHRNAFLERISAIIAKIPAGRRMEWRSDVGDKSTVVYPGIDIPAATLEAEQSNRPPRILWNHRWEYDKRPGPFFRSLVKLAGEGLAFEVIVLGENPQVKPKEFLHAREALGDRIIRWGYAESRREYEVWVAAADIVISTAIQENFGIAVVEAIGAGCRPLLPRRLSYPEIIPEAFHDRVLYGNEADLLRKLRRLLTLERRSLRLDELSKAMRRFAWDAVIDQYDSEIETTVRSWRYQAP